MVVMMGEDFARMSEKIALTGILSNSFYQ